MLRGASQTFRQSLYAKVLLHSVFRSTVHPAIPVVRPLHKSINIQCPSAAHAVLRTNSHHWWSEVIEPDTPSQPVRSRPPAKPKHPAHQGNNSSSGRDRRKTLYPDPPVALLIDHLSSPSDLRSFKPSSREPEMAQLMVSLRDRGKALDLAILMADTSRPHRALQALALAHNLGCMFKHTAYHTIAHQLASKDYWDLVRRVVELGRRQSGRTTIRLLNWRTRALVETQDFASLDAVLAVFESEQLKPTRRTFHLVVSGHLRNRDLIRAKYTLGQMEAAGLPADASTHAIIVSSYRSLGADPTVKAKALDALTTSDQKGATSIVNNLIQLSLDAHDMPAVLSYLAIFDQRRPVDGPLVDGGANTTREDGDHGRRAQAHRKSDPVQDATTFTMLIDYFARKADLARAMEIYNRMQSTGIRPDQYTAAALIRAHFAGGDPRPALRMVASMCQDLPKACMLLQRIGLERSDLDNSCILSDVMEPTAPVFNALLQGALKTHGLEAVRVVEKLMWLHGVQMDGHTIGIFLSHLDQNERARPRELIRLLRSFSSKSITPTAHQLGVVLRSILRRERKSLLRQSARTPENEDRLHERQTPLADRLSGVSESFDPVGGIQFPNWLSYRTLMQPLLCSFQKRRVRSDRAAFAMRIWHDAVIKGDMEMAKQTFELMVGRGLHPNQYHFAALMQGYADAGDMSSAIDIFRSALKLGVRPNAHMYTILIVGYGKQGDPTQALRTFEDMVAAGVKPDPGALHALVKSFVAAKAHAEGKRILLRLWTSVAPFPDEMQGGSLLDLLKALARIKPGIRVLPDRLSSTTQRALRWRVRELTRSWVGRQYFPDSLLGKAKSSPSRRMRKISDSAKVGKRRRDENAKHVSAPSKSHSSRD